MKAIRKAATEKTLVVFDHSDYVTASSWSVPDGLTSANDDYARKHTEIVVIGGTLGTTYTVTNTATLENNEVSVKSVLVQVVEK